MRAARPRVLVTYPPLAADRDVFEETLGGLADITYLPRVADGDRAGALASADVLLAKHLDRELRPAEFALLEAASLIQLVPAGADDIPFGLLPGNVPVAVNAGAYADPMAEHVLALTRAGAARRRPRRIQEVTVPREPRLRSDENAFFSRTDRGVCNSGHWPRERVCHERGDDPAPAVS